MTWKELLPLVVIVVGFLVVYLRQRSRSSLYDYRCENCGGVFSVSPFVATMAPKQMGQRLLQCPACGARTWATPVAKK